MEKAGDLSQTVFPAISQSKRGGSTLTTSSRSCGSFSDTPSSAPRRRRQSRRSPREKNKAWRGRIFHQGIKGRGEELSRHNARRKVQARRKVRLWFQNIDDIFGKLAEEVEEQGRHILGRPRR